MNYQQWQEVMKRDFFITDEDQEAVIYSRPLSELLIKENMQELIDLYSPNFKALHPAATAAALARWFASLPLAVQYTSSIMNETVDLSPQNVTVRLYSVQGTYRFSFKLDRWATFPFHHDQPREEWLYQRLAAFYRETMQPLFETLAESVQMNAGQLWGQLPRKFDIYLDQWKHRAGDELHEQIDQDYRFLAEKIEPDVFGRKRNPFRVKQRFIDSLDDKNKQVPVECTCCLNYLREGEKFCFTCPRLTEKDREEMRKNREEEIRANG
ncbi:hypothetical protein GCM10008986_30560 [Salinibacillus aidingensis]|uniref:Ferric iron reductase protein FhuF, involved in iron transport n=1 Tax=Salinibacillus aidingensis TaxID=237684 RepID=A0ABP3LJ58_9BACI